VVPQIASPLLFATHASGGKWKPQRHLAYIDRKITDALSGRGSKRLLVTIPPRHGKSEFISKWFPAWFVGMYPNKRVMLASYEADFAAGWGRKARAILEEWGHLFGVQVDPASRAANRWGILGASGGMQTAGAGGPLTGSGADILVVDDAIKNSEEAGSDTIRSKLWDWWLSTAYSRIEPGGVAIVLHTRWHEDDLIGRLIQEMDNGGEAWEVINFPAIAEEHDVLGRKPGEALWPARYDEKALERIKNTIGPYWWSSLYQQRPSPLEGGMFKREWFKVIEEPGKITKRCRYWDLAATQGGGDYTVGALIGLNDEGDYILLDVVRGQWEPHRRDAIIQATAASDGREVMIRAEQEPGASGVAQIDAMTRRLTGYRFKGEKVTGDKVVRADAASSQAGIGRIKLLKGEWNRAFLDEVTMFPNGKHDDQVDAFSGAFNALTKPVSSFCVA
jgi:predicted phage terminase large subunit-like protein